MLRTARFSLGRRWGAKAQSALFDSAVLWAGRCGKAPYCNRFLAPMGFSGDPPESIRTTGRIAATVI